MKQILSLFLIFVRSLSLSIPAFADVINDPKFVHSWPIPFALVLLIVIITALLTRKRRK